jgi:hypothetical protein
MTKHAVVFPTRAVPCPACYARAGEPCKLPGGNPTSPSHAARVKAYRLSFKRGSDRPKFIGNR